MCDLCLSFPHLPGCPNAPEPTPVHTCENCKRGIFPGDDFYEGYRGPICRDCLEDMTVIEFLKFEGETLSTVESDYEK